MLSSVNFRALRNLGSSATHAAVLPWEFRADIAPELRLDKRLRDGWITSKLTEHHVYGVAVGKNPNQRVTKATRDGEGNPPHSLWGIAADFDSPYSPDEVQAAIAAKLCIKPVWYERTLSGNARLVWVFERPTPVPSFNFATAFLTSALERLKANAALAGLDHKASTNPSRYFTNSGEWYPVPGGEPIPIALAEGWLVEVGRAHRFDRDTETRGDVIGDIGIVRDALRARYPRFAEWPGEFVEGEMGPSFWVDGSESPKSATVRAGGMQTFSAHASHGFYSWSELLDSSVVKNLQSQSVGAATRDIYYDGRSYWVPDPERDTWITVDKDNLDTYLVSKRGCSRKTSDLTGTSPLADAKLHIAVEQRVANVGCAVFFPRGLIEGPDGEPMLNISTRLPLSPTEERGVVWGDGGDFPFISAFYEWFLPVPEARTAFLAWLSHAYAGALARRPTQGQAVFIAGPPGVGKSMHTQAVLGRLFGGVADASAYLHGKDSFGGELFESFLLRSDDNGLFVDGRTRATAAERMKCLVANPEQRVHVKYAMPRLSYWFGRLVATTNVDPDSLSALPEVSSSVEGKVSLFRTSDIPFPRLAMGRDGVDAAVAHEIAYFARWLVEHPAHSTGAALDSRFGVAAYHDPGLLIESRAQSSSSTVRDIIDGWRHEALTETWVGSVVDLRMAMLANQARHEILRAVPLDRFRRDVLKIASLNTGWLTSSNGLFTVTAPERKPAAAGEDRVTLSTTNSKTYDKNAPHAGTGTGGPCPSR